MTLFSEPQGWERLEQEHAELLVENARLRNRIELLEAVADMRERLWDSFMRGVENGLKER